MVGRVKPVGMVGNTCMCGKVFVITDPSGHPSWNVAAISYLSITLHG